MDIKAMTIRQMVAIPLSIIVLGVQGAVFDYFMIEEESPVHYAWIAVDVLIAIVWISLFARNPDVYKLAKEAKDWLRRHCCTTTSPDSGEKDHLKLTSMWFAWFIYATVSLTPRVIYLYHQIAPDLTEAEKVGPNLLKMSVCLTAVLFLCLVTAHQGSEIKEVKYYLDRVTVGVVLDLLDNGEFLDSFFTEDHRVGKKQIEGGEEFKVPPTITAFILLFSALNMIIPTFGIIELECEETKALRHSRGKSPWTNFRLIYVWSRQLCVNIPFFVIRTILWAKHDREVSVLLVKNAILIVMDGQELWEYYMERSELKKCRHCKHRFRKEHMDEHTKACIDDATSQREKSVSSSRTRSNGGDNDADGLDTTVETPLHEFSV